MAVGNQPGPLTLPEPHLIPSTSAREGAPVVLAPFRVGLDWLTLSMSGPLRILDYRDPYPWRGANGERYAWVPTKYKSNVFDRIFYLIAEDGRKLLTVQGQPVRGVTAKRPDWMLVQFENETLHTGEFAALYGQLCDMGFTYLAVSKIDVCADGIKGNGGDFMEPVQRTWAGDMDYYGKAHWRPAFDRRKVKAVELGTRGANKFLRCYDKTRELKQQKNVRKRDYINAAWEQSLGDRPEAMGITVNRLEISTKGKEVRRHWPDEKRPDFVERIAQPAHLLEMFASMVPGMFDFRYRTDGRARDAAPGIQWDFAACGIGEPVRVDRLPRALLVAEQSVKVTLKTLFLAYYQGKDETLLRSAEQIAAAANLSRWMEDAFQRWTVYAVKMKATKDPFTIATLGRIDIGQGME